MVGDPNAPKAPLGGVKGPAPKYQMPEGMTKTPPTQKTLGEGMIASGMNVEPGAMARAQAGGGPNFAGTMGSNPAGDAAAQARMAAFKVGAAGGPPQPFGARTPGPLGGPGANPGLAAQARQQAAAARGGLGMVSGPGLAPRTLPPASPTQLPNTMPGYGRPGATPATDRWGRPLEPKAATPWGPGSYPVR